jgi:AraC-like DNA-binding protein
MAQPHWHAQVEINFLVRGWLEYQMHDHAIALQCGNLCLFWGGMPHQLTDASGDVEYVVVHLPLQYFFRLRLPDHVQMGLMHGATLVTSATTEADRTNIIHNSVYISGGSQAQRDFAVRELMLRLERIQFDPYALIEPDGPRHHAAGTHEQQLFRNVLGICDFIAENFRDEIDSVDIASHADIHPKYAMSIFKRSTGLTLNEYVNLLRLSYAQARLVNDDANVLSVAMDSGFGSLSAFNKSFRRIAGKSPTDFRRDARRIRSPAFETAARPY